MANAYMQLSESVTESTELPVLLDREWLDELNRRLDEHGSRIALARALGVAPSTVSKLANGQYASAQLVVRVAEYLGMALPAAWVGERAQRITRVLREAETMARDIADEKKRAAMIGLIDANVDDMEDQLREMAEHLSRLVRAHRKKN